DRFAASTDVSACQDLLLDCTARPGPQATAPQLAAARATLDHVPSPPPRARLACGMHDFRAGRYAHAAEALRAAAKDFPADQMIARVTAEQFAAMAEQHIGHADEALRLFHSADPFFTSAYPLPRVDDPGAANVDDWLLSEAARREAQSLVR